MQDQYQTTLGEVQARLNRNSALASELNEADKFAQQSLQLGAQHLQIHNQILTLSEQFSNSYQNTSNRWLSFNADMRTVNNVIKIAAQDGDPNAQQIEANARPIMEKLVLIRNMSAAVAGIKQPETLEFTINNLQRNADIIAGNLANLKDTSRFLHRKLGPYVELAQSLSGSPDALFDLSVRLNKANAESKLVLNQLGIAVNSSLMLQDRLIENVVSQKKQSAQQVEVTNDKAIAALLGVLVVSLVLGCLIIWNILHAIRTPLKSISGVLQRISDGDLSQQVVVKHNVEFGQIGAGLNGLIGQQREIIRDISDNAGIIEKMTARVSQTTNNSLTKLQEQKDKSQTIVAATKSLTESSEHISKEASETLNDVEDVNQAAGQSKDNVQSSQQSVQELVTGLNSAGNVINSLQQESENISQILTTIQGIAEQTNLLALNAAIEAARAGEQGRGFAVVADEVRSLASKTQSSTKEIYSMIESLQTQANAATNTMEQNLRRIASLADNATVTDQSVETILESLTAIHSKSETIDSQTTEQRQTVNDVAQEIISIALIADEIFANASKNAESFTELSALVQRQSHSVSLFRLT